MVGLNSTGPGWVRPPSRVRLPGWEMQLHRGGSLAWDPFCCLCLPVPICQMGIVNLCEEVVVGVR